MMLIYVNHQLNRWLIMNTNGLLFILFIQYIYNIIYICWWIIHNSTMNSSLKWNRSACLALVHLLALVQQKLMYPLKGPCYRFDPTLGHFFILPCMKNHENYRNITWYFHDISMIFPWYFHGYFLSCKLLLIRLHIQDLHQDRLSKL